MQRFQLTASEKKDFIQNYLNKLSSEYNYAKNTEHYKGFYEFLTTIDIDKIKSWDKLNAIILQQFEKFPAPSKGFKVIKPQRNKKLGTLFLGAKVATPRSEDQSEPNNENEANSAGSGDNSDEEDQASSTASRENSPRQSI